MNEIPKPKSRWRLLRRALVGVAVLITLVALLVTEEDWRGKHDWESYRHKWEAKGEKFDAQAFAPPAVPDDQNFFTAPIVTNLLNGKIHLSPERSDGGPPQIAAGNWQTSSLTDLKVWQTYYRNPTNTTVAKEFPIAPGQQTPAADLLFALGKYDFVVEELRVASQRPYANILMDYNDPLSKSVSNLFPIFATLKRCARTVQLRAIAELANGQSEKASADVKLLLALDNSIRNSPFLISHLVHLAIANLTLQPIYEGLVEHRWSDEQLAELDLELAKLDFLADYEFAMRGERTCAIDYLENMRRTRELVYDIPGGFVTNKFTIMPSAFFYQNELNFARIYQERLCPEVDIPSRIISPQKVHDIDSAMQAEKKWYSPYKIEALMTASAVANAVKKFAFVQSSFDLARVACALERYRLAHGEYPESLEPIAPQYIAQLPHDIINGQLLHYRRNPDGQFVLYSVGWNETDDGGVVVIDKKQGTLIQTEGDWVWKYPDHSVLNRR
jgi:tetratricopeptide (TPR) repeat protein